MPLLIQTSFWNGVENIAYNIVGGFLTVAITWLFQKRLKEARRRRFKKVFGSTSSFSLIYGDSILHPKLQETCVKQLGQDRPYFLFKRSNPSAAISATNIASSCEIRAAAYVALATARDGHILTSVASDETLWRLLDVDFISFGAMSNLKTVDLFANYSNSLVEFDMKSLQFVWRESRKPLFKQQAEFDYGIIQKLHPKQFPERTWITCAGVGEWGTSGAAWFLANKWGEIEKKLKTDRQFVAVIEVKPEQDESALMKDFYEREP